MTNIPIQQAQLQLPELIHQLAPGGEVVITENDLPIARIVQPAAPQPKRKLGSLRGTVLYMAPDFDAPLDEFKEFVGAGCCSTRMP
jgi:antitoxin (DNA-binding transcriptional repressor) of toxin-antitoxin stability system